jgi:hypothetical protein
VLAFTLATSEPGASKFTAGAAESFIRTWWPMQKYSRVYKIFGSLAQLFTKTLRNPDPNNKNDKALMTAVAESIDTFLHRPIQVRMMWAAMFTIRKHYFNKEDKSTEEDKTMTQTKEKE